MLASPFFYFSVMEVASGEHDVDLVKAAKSMTYFKPEPSEDGMWNGNVTTIPALPGPLGRQLHFLIYINDYFNYLFFMWFIKSFGIDIYLPTYVVILSICTYIH